MKPVLARSLRALLVVLMTAAFALPSAAPALAAQGPPPRPAAPPSPDPSLTSHPLAAAPGPVDNPLKGFARFYSPGSNQNTGYPHSLTWTYFGLSEVMTNASNCGSYDWTLLDNALAESATYGNQVALRFYLEYPGGSGTHPANAIPRCFDGHVPYRTNAYWNTTSPDYDNAYLLTALKNFIAAFGARYDGDPRLGFVHTGLVGLWGEWHTWPYDTDTSGDSYPNYMPTDAHGAEILRAYDVAFNTTKLEVRYPGAGGSAASGYDIGYHDDSFCYREGSPLAGVTLPASLGGASYSQLQRALEQNVENKWITSSMGGEVRPEIQPQAFSFWPGGSGQVDNMKACIELEHATWKMNEQSANYSATDPNVAAAVRLMGYNLRAANAYYKDSVSGTARVGVQLVNDGVAPFYYPWTVKLGLKNAAGTVVKSWDTSWDLRKVMPLKIRAFPEWGVGSDPTYRDFGYPQYFQTDVGLTGVANGNYQLVLRVQNPLENINANAKKLRFANATQHADGWLGLGPIAVGSSGQPGAQTVEAEAAGNTLSGGAVVASCATCSGGSKVGWLGNGAALAVNQVGTGTAGNHTLTISYSSAVSRNATITVNGGTPITVNFPATADWTTVGTKSITIPLNASNNVVRIANPSDWAPDIDKVSFTKV